MKPSEGEWTFGRGGAFSSVGGYHSSHKVRMNSVFVVVFCFSSAHSADILPAGQWPLVDTLASDFFPLTNECHGFRVAGRAQTFDVIFVHYFLFFVQIP
jgi:hypothetical protein